MPDEVPPPNTTVVTGIPGAVAVIADTTFKWSKMTAIQVITAGAMVSMFAITGLLIYLVFSILNDRKEERTTRDAREESFLRATEEARERERQFETLERAKDRQIKVEEIKMILAHCTEESLKQRETDKARWDKLGRDLSTFLKGKIKPEEDEIKDGIPIVAPMPRKKIIVP